MSTTKGSTEGSSGGPPSKDPRNKSKATEKVTAASAQGREGSLARQAARRPADRAPTSAAPFEVGRFENGGVTMYYEIHGSGPRVFVFMHGILLDANLNRRLATDLAAAGNRVILLDLPGHGLSDKPRRASYHRMDTYARHVEALLEDLRRHQHRTLARAKPGQRLRTLGALDLVRDRHDEQLARDRVRGRVVRGEHQHTFARVTCQELVHRSALARRVTEDRSRRSPRRQRGPTAGGEPRDAHELFPRRAG